MMLILHIEEKKNEVKIGSQVQISVESVVIPEPSDTIVAAAHVNCIIESINEALPAIGEKVAKALGADAVGVFNRCGGKR